MKQLNLAYDPQLRCDFPERVIQFGEGNFLRGFIDWMIYRMNQKGLFKGRVVAVQPTPRGRVVGKLNAQDGLYTTVLRGMQDGAAVDEREIITSISRGINPYEDWQACLRCAEDSQIEYVFSNTTEAGLAYRAEDALEMEPPLSYPGKLTAYLYHRYRHFGGASDKGMWILPCELLEKNGEILKSLVLRYSVAWGLPEGFRRWIETSNTFVNTLVDRVVSGYPAEEIESLTAALGYEDLLLVCGEPFHFFAMEGGEALAERLPFAKAGLQAVVASDIAPYRLRKVRILNGAHTACVPAAFMAGLDTVAEMMADEAAGAFLRRTVQTEILPSIPLDPDMLGRFADDVAERFANPFIRHQLLSILLNGSAKFKARVLPSILEYRERSGALPRRLLFSFAAYLYLYRGETMEDSRVRGMRAAGGYELTDDAAAVRALREAWRLYDGTERGAEKAARAALRSLTLWGADLTEIAGLAEAVGSYLYALDREGARAVMARLSGE